MIMKISKLFHWLYAVLMFLPLVMFLPSCLYYAFNDNATAQEQTKEEPIYYQSNEITTYNDLAVNKVYRWVDNVTYTVNDTKYLFNIKKETIKKLLPTDLYEDITTVRFTLVNNSAVYYLNYIQNNISGWVAVNNVPFDFVISGYAANFNETENIISGFTYSNALIVESYEEVIYNLSITDSINYAWNSVWNLPLFAWTKNSFVSAPFTYITGLFGLSSTNSLNYVFTYFCSISICWLVFDLIMYVPNLAHRWLDKGVIE